MERFIIASLLLLLLASLTVVEGRMGRAAVFDNSMPTNHVLIGGDELPRICDQVRFKTICRGFTKLPGVATPRQLLLASIRVASDKAKEAKLRVEEYKARTHASGPMESISDTCSKGYDDVVQSLEETRQLIETKGTNFDLNNKVSDAVTHAGDCTTGFEDFPDIKSPFAAIQQNVYRVVDNVLNIAVVVQQAEAHQAKLLGPHVH
ncbi:hypothetical protein PAHAL_3G195700 [Panicum hallii]|uniref:Pectinesterase inhibitor domain-containing protein n=1 Tax=Panicum hallii TaxID=206008 RepID=A0A2S3HA31_9POAL|nr:uncharacterized protein LOC112887845 [Panicum hallii]PAN18343.1 hypothetical protein PAHAL_3G195700 [Panicum hallii]